MTWFTVFGMFATWTREQRQAALPGEYAVETPDGQIDVWAVFATAAVSLTGGMATIDISELGTSLAQFRVMFENGVYNWDDWQAESRAVLLSLASHGEPDDATGDRPTIPAFSSN